jgi:hypothetical protein
MDIYNLGQNIQNDHEFPVFDSLNFYNVFTLGFFDKYGSIFKKTILNDIMSCDINAPTKPNIIKKIKDLYRIKSDFDEQRGYISFHGINCFKFLNCLYDNSDPRYRKNENYKIYFNWVTFGLGLDSIPTCRFFRKSDKAITPNKTELGFDLHIISKIKNIGNKTVIYDTGIVMIPEFGFNIKILPNTSLIKYGYILSNIQYVIINNSTVKIYLTKIDEKLPDIKLPFNCCQIILERSIYYVFEEVTNIQELADSDIFLSKIKS